MVNVWVIVICCFWLFDNLKGYWLVWLLRFKWFNKVCVCCFVFVLDCFKIVVGVKVIFCMIVKLGNNLKFWNIILIILLLFWLV